MAFSALSFSYFYYPQYRWARRLRALLPSYLTDRAAVIVDAPCGDGVISYWLWRSGKIAHSFELYDRSPQQIAKAQRFAGSRSAVRAEARDIFAIESSEHRADVWLLVNSLYLLPDIDRLVAKMRLRFRVIIAVFPYLDRANYRYYRQRIGCDENVNGMSDEDTVAFFARHGYRLDHREDAAPLSQHRFSFPGLRRLLNVLEPLARGGSGNYWIGVFVRDDTVPAATS